MSACPTTDRLRSLLDGELSEAEQSELQQHIDECEACQKTLEGLVAGQESWDGIARQLGDQTPVTPALQDVMAEAIGATASITTAHSVKLPPGLLQPAQQADSIGRLAHYEVLQEVGSGGMGIVLKAFDTSLRRVVAIKVMAPHLAANAAARRRFVREAQAAAAVAHEHVVAIHAVADQHEPPYLAMQFIEGKTLQERLDKSGPLSVREVLRIGMQTASGLAAAHAQGLVHRDIKPANILLENGVERVKLTDFGLARAVDDASVTQSGVIAGTPLFMSPEQARGESIDHRSDLFSLGSVLYAMCVGHAPFRASTTMGVLKRVCDEPPRPIREVNPDIPDWLANIIAKLLAKKPSDRFQSAKEVAELLEQCLAHVQKPGTTPLPATASSLTAFANAASVSRPEPLREQPVGVWRRGRLLVMHRFARLPDRCVKTNAPTTERLERHLFWHHPILYGLLVFTPIVFLIFARLFAKQADIQIGLCRAERVRRRWVIGIGWLGGVAGVALTVFGFSQFSVGMILAGIVILLLFGATAAKLAEVVSIDRIEGDYLYLRGVSRQYLDQLPEGPQLDGAQSGWHALTNGKGMRSVDDLPFADNVQLHALPDGQGRATHATSTPEPVVRKSEGWRLRCTKCGTHRSLASVGGVRMAAVSKGKFTLGWCSVCRAFRSVAVEWGEIDPNEPPLPRAFVIRRRIGFATGLIGGLLTIAMIVQRTSHPIPGMFGVWFEHACEAALFLMAMFFLLAGVFAGWHHGVREQPRTVGSMLRGLSFAAICLTLFVLLTDNLAGRWKGWRSECAVRFQVTRPEDADLRFELTAKVIEARLIFSLPHNDLLAGVPANGTISRLPHGEYQLRVHRDHRVVYSESLKLYPGQWFTWPLLPSSLETFSKLQGRWQIVSAKGNITTPADDFTSDWWIEFNEDRVTVSDAARTGVLQRNDLRFGIAPNGVVPSFDLIGHARGTFRLDGDLLTLGLANPGEPSVATSDLTTAPTQIVCRRINN